MKENPSEQELNEIVAAIQSGDRLKATSLYISSTGRGLGDAQQFVRELKEQIKNPEVGKE